MSKAFTRETDDGPEVPVTRRPGSGLPPGATNYLTEGGARRLREELDRLLEAAGSANGDGSAGGGSQDRQRFLRELLRTAVVVKPSTGSVNRVRFGTRVTVRGVEGATATYHIVGVDEADPEQGRISCISPLARALANRCCGEQVRFEVPSGTETSEILSIERG